MLDTPAGKVDIIQCQVGKCSRHENHKGQNESASH